MPDRLQRRLAETGAPADFVLLKAKYAKHM
jgi:hypothetical protein